MVCVVQVELKKLLIPWPCPSFSEVSQPEVRQRQDARGFFFDQHSSPCYPLQYLPRWQPPEEEGERQLLRQSFRLFASFVLAFALFWHFAVAPLLKQKWRQAQACWIKIYMRPCAKEQTLLVGVEVRTSLEGAFPGLIRRMDCLLCRGRVTINKQALSWTR